MFLLSPALKILERSNLPSLQEYLPSAENSHLDLFVTSTFSTLLPLINIIAIGFNQT